MTIRKENEKKLLEADKLGIITPEERRFVLKIWMESDSHKHGFMGQEMVAGFFEREEKANEIWKRAEDGVVKTKFIQIK